MNQKVKDNFEYDQGKTIVIPYEIEHMANHMSFDKIKKDLEYLATYTFHGKGLEPLDAKRKDSILDTLKSLLEVSEKIISLRGIFYYDDGSGKDNLADDQLTMRIEGNLLHHFHFVLSSTSAVFRNIVCKECEWTISDYYNKVGSFKWGDGRMAPALIDKEPEVIYAVFDHIIDCLNQIYRKEKEIDNK